MISNADPELEQLVHTHRTSYQSCWPRGLGELTPSPISRIFFPVSVDSSPRSHLFTPVILAWQSEYLSVLTAPRCGTESISYVTFHFQDQCFVPVIARKSPFLCLNKGPIRNGFRACARATRYGVKIALVRSHGPEEMSLSLEHQNPSKTSEKMGYFDRVTVSLHILQTANQETEGSQDRRGYGLRLLIFKSRCGSDKKRRNRLQ